MRLDVSEEIFRLREAFTISRGSRTEARVLTVRIEQDGVSGYGECVPYARYGETPASVIKQILSLSMPLDRARLQEQLPAGAARNAVDCAVWDLQAKASGTRVWEVAGLPRPRPVMTAYTLSLDTPERMEDAAALNAGRPLLKVKLGGPGDRERLEAVRSGAPRSRIVVDANEGWSVETYKTFAPHLRRLRVDMVEQPFPAGDDAALLRLPRDVPVCADESCHDRDSLAALAGKYDMVNIKLDKTGGLTEALALSGAARASGFGVMVGCMVGTSLAMAPAVLLAQDAEVADLDGPLLLAEDRETPLTYDADGVHPPSDGLWG